MKLNEALMSEGHKVTFKPCKWPCIYCAPMKNITPGKTYEVVGVHRRKFTNGKLSNSTRLLIRDNLGVIKKYRPKHFELCQTQGK